MLAGTAKDRSLDLRTAGRKDVLITIVPAPFDDLARVTFVLLDRGIRQEPNVVMHVKVEQRSRLAACFANDKVIKTVVMWNDQVLLVDRNGNSESAEDMGW